MDEPILSDNEWEAEIQRAAREIRRQEYDQRKSMFRKNVSPWVV